MSKSLAIVSAYGRGHWLAAAFAGKGYKVTLIDVSQAMGRWAPEDWEGPFGFFQTEQMLPQQLECLNEQDYHDSVDEGFALWLKDGPLDMKGPISPYLLKKSGLLANYQDYLINSSHKSADEVHQELQRHSFSETWLIYMAYLLAANRIDLDQLVLDKDMHMLPILSPLYVRRVSRRGWEQSLEWCENKGVRVIRQAQVTDVASEGKICQGLEIEGDWSGVVSADQFIWMVTSEESARFPLQVVEKLFPKGVLKSSWAWLRFRVHLGEAIKQLPQKMVVLEDLYLPWTHDNLCLMQKTVNGVDADVWVRIPCQHRFQRGYVENMGQKILSLLHQRLPEVEPKLLDMPQDYHYEAKDLGPSPFPIYERKQLMSFRPVQFRNLSFASPENWCSQDWSGQMRRQKQSFDKIYKKMQDSKESTASVEATR